MTDKESSQKPAETRKERGGHGAVIVALFAVAVIAVAWFWMTRKPPQDAGLGAEHGIIVVGAGALLTSLIAYIRNMDLSDVLEMLGELVMGLFSLIGAILKGIWSTICGIFGWD